MIDFTSSNPICAQPFSKCCFGVYYKRKQTEGLLPVMKEQFNTVISKPCVTSEHTIGMLKLYVCLLKSVCIWITANTHSFEKILYLL